MKKIIFLILFVLLFFMGCNDYMIDEPKIDRIIMLGREGSGLLGTTAKLMRITDVQINEENPKQIVCVIKGYKID